MMIGGINQGLGSNEVTVTKDAAEFEELEPLPYSSYHHCVAGIDDTTIFVTGLGTNDDESFMYYKDTKEWVSLPNMPTGRLYMGCGVVGDVGDGRGVEVVVVGGYIPGSFSYLDVVEIFDVAKNSWRTGECL